MNHIKIQRVMTPYGYEDKNINCLIGRIIPEHLKDNPITLL